MKKKYAIVGVGGRGIGMFAVPLIRDYSDVAELVGFCDINPIRMEVAQKRVGMEIPTYTDFDAMLKETAPDTVIVTSKDSTHHDYIIAALEQDKDVIVEKPMTIDEEKCRAILDAEKKSGRSVRVTFNYRFTPYVTKVKELLREGIVGDIYSVDFHWYLDTIHGADYYRRWHGRKCNSGGLLVHKATHHFDLVNWFLEEEPDTVFAMGTRNFYGDKGRAASNRCLECPEKETCNFYFDISASSNTKELYLDAEKADGYIRDGCIFAKDIDAEDTMAVMVRYNKGTQLSYTLGSYMPFEGWEMAINGSKGRLECGVAETYFQREAKNLRERTSLRKSLDPKAAAAGDLTPITADTIRFYPIFGGVEVINVDRVKGGHGGGDVRLRDMLFREGIPDPLDHLADSWQGAMSIMVGISANRSIATGLPVNVKEFLNVE
jgi:predicted dehydrogenase